MLLTGYSLDIREAAACKPGSRPLFCEAILADDIGKALPYINSELGALGYTREPLSMIIEFQGHQVVIEPEKIIINEIADAMEAIGLLEVLQKMINDIWQRRETIRPKTSTKGEAKVMDVVALLPKTNCGLCGLETCIVFADRLLRGEVVVSDCPVLNSSDSGLLQGYLDQFD